MESRQGSRREAIVPVLTPLQGVEEAGSERQGRSLRGPAEVAAMGEMTQGKCVPGNAVLHLLPGLTQPQGFQKDPQVWEEAPQNCRPLSRSVGTLVGEIGKFFRSADILSKLKKDDEHQLSI